LVQFETPIDSLPVAAVHDAPAAGTSAVLVDQRTGRILLDSGRRLARDTGRPTRPGPTLAPRAARRPRSRQAPPDDRRRTPRRHDAGRGGSGQRQLVVGVGVGPRFLRRMGRRHRTGAGRGRAGRPAAARLRGTQPAGQPQRDAPGEPLRRAHRPAEPPAARRPAAVGAAARRPAQQQLRRAAPRPRPVQGGQRHPRPPLRRPHAPRSRGATQGGRAVLRHRGPARRATSSPSCSPRWTAPAAPMRWPSAAWSSCTRRSSSRA
jgi:hypothetical protein